MPDQAFEHMVHNAMSFLRLATSDYINRPDQTAIRVYTAIELILKARLLHEHWSLIISRKPDRAAFEAGDFQSVAFDEICVRLRDALQEPLQNETRKAFDDLRKARNLIVHFASPGLRRDVDKWKHERATQALVKLAWTALHDLMRFQWREVFLPFFSELDAIEGIMNRSSNIT